MSTGITILHKILINQINMCKKSYILHQVGFIPGMQVASTFKSQEKSSIYFINRLKKKNHDILVDTEKKNWQNPTLTHEENSPWTRNRSKFRQLDKELKMKPTANIVRSIEKLDALPSISETKHKHLLSAFLFHIVLEVLIMQ